VKIGPVDTEMALLIVKKKKLENAWQSLAYSPFGAVVSPPNEYASRRRIASPAAWLGQTWLGQLSGRPASSRLSSGLRPVRNLDDDQTAFTDSPLHI